MKKPAKTAAGAASVATSTAQRRTASRPKETPARKKRVPKVRLEKDPARALVYTVFGKSRSKPLLRRDVYRTLLAGERAVGAATTSAASPRICAEGDSWINILSEISGYPKTFFDVIQDKYADTTSVAYPGDTLQDMLIDMDYEQPIKSGVFDFFIFSGGGVDVLGGGALADLLRRREDVGSSSDPKDYLNLEWLDAVLDAAKSAYLKIAKDVDVWSARTRMLVHGYDYPVARNGGIWIGIPFRNRGYDLTADKVIIKKIMTHLVDRFYAMLAEVAKQRKNVTVVDLRNICRGRWHDELHAKEAASRDFATEFIKEFPALTA